MTNDDILDLIRRCNIRDGEELIPGNAYLFNKKFRRNANGGITYEQEELIVLVKRGIKVGGIYRMGSYDIHVVMDERFEGQHIMSDFLRTGLSMIFGQKTPVWSFAAYIPVKNLIRKSI
ncbi:hypothetical protein [Pseudoflavonifractor sp. HCP28S3_F10]|uniref:hypothetical protein n=1 Tax=Pseudoflavonifractor sp. HCP28S3_F10 TaxID=3438947 RepID=UPI003F888A99